jgi:hypothetical protein
MALLFIIDEVGRAVTESLRAHSDRLRIAIIEGDTLNDGKPGYTVHVMAKPTECPPEGRLMATRWQTMPRSDTFARFKDAHAREGRCVLTQARMTEAGGIELNAAARIDNVTVVFRQAAEIGPHDIDHIVLERRPADGPVH